MCDLMAQGGHSRLAVDKSADVGFLMQTIEDFMNKKGSRDLLGSGFEDFLTHIAHACHLCLHLCCIHHVRSQ